MSPPQPPARRMNVVVTCRDTRHLRPVWMWVALPAAFGRAGHEVSFLEEGLNERLLDCADFILADPERTLHQANNGGAILDYVYTHCAIRTHHAKKVINGSLASEVSKLKAAEISKVLGLEHPRVFSSVSDPDATFPLVAKPNFGSRGKGIRLLWSRDGFPQFPRGSYVLQEYLDTKTGYAISFRIITVVDRVLSGAMFYNKSTMLSNLSQGGDAIAFTGPNRSRGLSHEQEGLVRRLGLDPANRSIPEEVLQMTAKVGKYLSARGAQILGQDYIVDRNGHWYFCEANAYPGYLVLDITDGEGKKQILSGYRLATRMLSDAIVEAFGS